MLVRHALSAVLAAAGSIAALSLALLLPPSIDLKLGPGDRDYAQGFSDPFRFDGEVTFRRLEGRARAALPLLVREGGTLEVVARSSGSAPASLTLRFDDGTAVSATVPPSSGGFQGLRFEIPPSGPRAHVRLRADTEPVEVSALRWQPAWILPNRSLALAAGLLGALSYLAFAAAGLRARVALAGVSFLFAALAILARIDGFAFVHLTARLPWAASLGLALVGIARIAAKTASFRALLFIALLFKASLLFHPRFYFFDWPIHETLLELLYHRGALDFHSRLVDYQQAHNVGVGQVGGEARVFPYPVLFYYTAHIGNRFHHAPELWLKLGAAMFATLALLPLGYLARRLTPYANADFFAALAYLLVPSLTRSLLLLELSAVAGCFFDLLAVAALAALNLKLDRARGFALATLAMAASLAAYTAGFVHLGLLVGCALALVLGERLLGPVITAGSWSGRDALRLAFAGILALGLAIFAYHPKAVAALATAVLSQSADSPASAAAPLGDLVDSSVARARSFLGIPLIAAGALGLALALRGLDPSPLRLLYSAWALSAVAAYFLRYLFIDLFQYQKELYWAAALLALGSGVLACSVRKRILAAALLLALLASFAVEFRVMAEQFYRSYLFL